MSGNAPRALPPRPPRGPAAAASADLDAQIEQLEQRLVAREAWIRATAESLAQRAQRAATPRPWVWPVVGAGLLGWLGWRVWRRPQPARPANVVLPPTAVARDVSDSFADWPWAGLAASGWPLLPVAWRRGVSPATAAAVVSTVVAIGRRLSRRRGR